MGLNVELKSWKLVFFPFPNLHSFSTYLYQLSLTDSHTVKEHFSQCSTAVSLRDVQMLLAEMSQNYYSKPVGY